MDDLTKFLPKRPPSNINLNGRFVDLKTVDWEVHGPALAHSITGAENAHLWTFVPIGPFDDLSSLKTVMSYVGTQLNWETLAIISKTSGRALGTASYMRLRPEHGSAEVGCVIFGEALQKTKEATEAMFLMAKHIFDDLGYRRYEWKCDNGNDASKRAAERLGFEFEGVFRQDIVMKGKNRDTAWHSIIDKDWPRVKSGFEGWLAESNFLEDGNQISSLAQCRGKG
ncbi:MAG: GNAT family protein [Litorimonas sp.]